MSAAVAHPERLLVAFDEALDHEVRLIIYGRSAIWLGFDNPPAAAATTQDVDAIIPNDQVHALANDMGFWDARDEVNRRFHSEGLYITHLFPEGDIFLRRGWDKQIVPLSRLQLKRLKLFRPATIDLVLTKMMRGRDEQDMADAKFMILHDRVTKAQLMKAFSEMRPIELPELRDAFEQARPIVTEMAF